MSLTVVPHPGPWPNILEWKNEYADRTSSVLVLGENRSEAITLDLSKTAHMLIAGKTGSGKSVFVQNLMFQCLLKGTQVYLIDYKQGVDYTGRWTEFCDVMSDDNTVLSFLDQMNEIMIDRLATLKSSGVSNIDEFNRHGFGPMPRICIVVDELVECLDKTGATKERKEILGKIEARLSSFARLGRAAGMHLILCTQRGSADVLNGQIRNNVYKICGSADDNLSILTLGNADASRKIPTNAKGRFLTEDGIMFQGYFSEYPDSLFCSVALPDTDTIESGYSIQKGDHLHED